MTAKDHNKLLSIFYFIQGGLALVGGLFMVIVYGILGAAMLGAGQRGEERMVGGIFLGAAVVIGFVVLLIAAFVLFTGLKVYREEKLGRTLGIVVSCLSLLSFPLGTALGVYGLWFFLGDVGKTFYLARNSGTTFHHQAPPPASWQ